MFKLSSIASALLAMQAAALDQVTVNPETRMFEDPEGRTLIFHGQNVVYKTDPYIPSDGDFDPDNSLNDKDIADLIGWGQNFVRLGVMWEAVERTAGKYDEAYLDKVEALINKLGQAGIYTLVDMHQDVFARSICGEGFPDFYAKEAIKGAVCLNETWDWIFGWMYDKLGFCKSIRDYDGMNFDENDDPIITDCQKNLFGLYYTTKESFSAFDALFSNKDGLQDKFIAYWDHTSARFAKNPYVVGYDPFNEPLVGNPLHDLWLEKPGVADRDLLDPLYSKIFEKYMKNDDKSVMWFEPPPQPDTLPINGGMVSPVGFTTPPGAQIGSPNHVLNEHTYCCAMDYDSGVCENEEPTPAGAESCMKFHRAKL